MRQCRCLILLLLLLDSLTGRSEMICSPEPITALVGRDVILPCSLKAATSAALRTVEWTRPGLSPDYVHVEQDGRLALQDQNPSYSCRTGLFEDQLMKGNVSLKLSRVKLNDEGEYRCNLPLVPADGFIQLIVGAASSPVVTIADIDEDTGGVVLECRSSGWYPEPEVSWLDAGGDLLSAGRPETVRGPDDLYTVSSRVIVEKRHGRTFTCRLTQNKTKQTTETHFRVPGHFFSIECRLSATVIIAVYLGFFLPAAIGIFACKCHRNKIRRGEQEATRGRESSEQERRTERETERRTIREGTGRQ